MRSSGQPFSPQPDSDPPLVLPDLLAGLLEQANLEEAPMQALTPEVMAPDEQMPESVQSVQNMPEFLANLRTLLTAESASEVPYIEFPPAAAEDFPLGTNELLNYLLAELAEPPAPPEGFQGEELEDFPLGTNELLNYLLAEVAEPPEPQPGAFSPEAASDFEKATQDLLNELLAMTANPEPEPEPQSEKAFHDARLDLLGGLMASLEFEEPRKPDSAPEAFIDIQPEPEALAVEPEEPVVAEPSQELLDRELLDGLLARFEPEPELEPEPVVPTLPPLALELGSAPLEYVDESDHEAADRPAGPFELLLDAIDAELGPAPEIRGPAEPVTPVRVGERFVGFDLGTRAYALPFDCILETDRIPKSTYVPGMPAHVRGVLNLRGEILPLVDLRILFGMDSTPNDGRMLVVRDTTAKAPMALVVDRLSGLASLTPEELARKSAADHDPASSVLRGMVATGGRMVGLVDPERILTAAHGDAPVPKNRFSHLPTRGRSHV